MYLNNTSMQRYHCYQQYSNDSRKFVQCSGNSLMIGYDEYAVAYHNFKAYICKSQD